MTFAPIAANVPQPLDILLDLPAECSLDDETRIDDAGDLADLFAGQITRPLGRVYPRLRQNIVGELGPDP